MNWVPPGPHEPQGGPLLGPTRIGIIVAIGLIVLVGFGILLGIRRDIPLAPDATDQPIEFIAP